MIKKLLREALAFKGQIDEIDWSDTFSDVKKTCLDPEVVVNYLNDVRANASIEYDKRKKFDNSMPYIHAKSRLFNDKKDVDVKSFINKMTKKPKNIINTNKKILKSGGPNEFVYKTGVPAFKGIVFDINKQKFFIINTCPGAGACVFYCYARKGNYIRYPNSYDSLTRRVNYLLNYPDKYEEQMYNEIKAKCIEHKALSGYKHKLIIRWNDSGDFFAKRYVKIAEDVIERVKKEGYNVDSYAYNKNADVANDANFETAFSTDSNKKELKKVNQEKQKLSKTIPIKLFKDLDLMKIDDEKILKDRVAKYFNLNRDEVITYDEMKEMPKGNVRKWSVIVTPNDGDDAGFRKDVKNILLTEH